MSEDIPTFDSLMNPILGALFELGGSGSNAEIYEKVLELKKIDEEIASILHNTETSNETEVSYRLAWARTYLKKYGFLENSTRGVWSLTQLAKEKKTVIPKEVSQVVRDLSKKNSHTKDKSDSDLELSDNDIPDEVKGWKDELYHILTNRN